MGLNHCAKTLEICRINRQIHNVLPPNQQLTRGQAQQLQRILDNLTLSDIVAQNRPGHAGIEEALARNRIKELRHDYTPLRHIHVFIMVGDMLSLPPP
jgi:hypothetical protein